MIYIGGQVYNTGTLPSRTARRSVLESTADTFFIAPLAQNIIEQDEQDESKKFIYFDYQVTEKKGKA